MHVSSTDKVVIAPNSMYADVEEKVKKNTNKPTPRKQSVNKQSNKPPNKGPGNTKYTRRGSGEYTEDSISPKLSESTLRSSQSSIPSSRVGNPIRFNDLPAINQHSVVVNKTKNGHSKECAFCRSQGESVEVYSDHM